MGEGHRDALPPQMPPRHPRLARRRRRRGARRPAHGLLRLHGPRHPQVPLPPAVPSTPSLRVEEGRGEWSCRCTKENTGYRPPVEASRSLDEDFRRGLPYSYIQLCYWKVPPSLSLPPSPPTPVGRQMGDLEHAVGAAFTFLTLNPDDVMMSENIDFYSKQKGFKKEWLIDLYEYEYQVPTAESKRRGMKRKESWDFSGCTWRAFGRTRQRSGARRRRRCRRAWRLSWTTTATAASGARTSSPASPRHPPPASSTFTSRVRLPYSHSFGGADEGRVHPDAYVEYLNCTRNCTRGMERVRGTVVADLLPTYFHYLQFAYYKSRPPPHSPRAAVAE